MPGYIIRSSLTGTISQTCVATVKFSGLWYSGPFGYGWYYPGVRDALNTPSHTEVDITWTGDLSCPDPTGMNPPQNCITHFTYDIDPVDGHTSWSTVKTTPVSTLSGYVTIDSSGWSAFPLTAPLEVDWMMPFTISRDVSFSDMVGCSRTGSLGYSFNADGDNTTAVQCLTGPPYTFVPATTHFYAYPNPPPGTLWPAIGGFEPYFYNPGSAIAAAGHRTSPYPLPVTFNGTDDSRAPFVGQGNWDYATHIGSAQDIVSLISRNRPSTTQVTMQTMGLAEGGNFPYGSGQGSFYNPVPGWFSAGTGVYPPYHIVVTDQPTGYRTVSYKVTATSSLSNAGIILIAYPSTTSVAAETVNTRASSVFDNTVVTVWFGAISGTTKPLYVAINRSAMANRGSGSGSTVGWNEYTFSTSIDSRSDLGLGFLDSGRLVMTYDTYAAGGVKTSKYVASDSFGEDGTWSSAATMTPNISQLLSTTRTRSQTGRVRVGV